MEPGRRPLYFWDSRADDAAQFLRTLERLQQQQRPAQLEGRVRVRTNGPRDPMLFCESARCAVEARQHAARIVDLDRINLRKDFQQISQLPAATAKAVKWVRDADERVLFF